MKTTFQYDHYYKYEEIKSNLAFFEKEYPTLCKIGVNCVTPQNRNQYVVTLTNQETGDAFSKPGWYLDGNIHAGEVTASMTAMHTLDYLLTNYASDETCKKLLDTTTIYIIPRVTPDGAEKYLTTPYTLRSTPVTYLPEEGGVKEEDLDDDGVIRMMRIPSAYGAWKKDPNDDTHMVLRDPSDIDGQFYDIYPEGYLEEDTDINLKKKKADWGLDFNRNFPYGWFSDNRQPGAGAYPLSNIETKAIVDFVLAHPNICGAAIGHTSGGIILYPPGTRKADSAPKDDIEVFKAIANMGKEELGYEPLNIFDSFMDDQVNFDSGALDDWMYQSQGIPAYTMEYWDIANKAGVPINWNDHRRENPTKGIERFNACMKWVKENAPQHYQDWKAFDHPTFGQVELGGFNYKFTHQNPPEHLLQNECENSTRFNIRFAKTVPHLSIDEVNVSKKTEDVYEVSVIVGNLGYLPTNLTDEAITLKVDKPVEIAIAGGTLLSGQANEKIGNLSGYSRTVTGVYFYGNITTIENAKAKKKVTWLIQAKEGDEITITAKHEKAGTTSQTIKI